MKKIILIALATMAIGLTACGRYEDSSIVGYDVNIPINQAPQTEATTPPQTEVTEVTTVTEAKKPMKVQVQKVEETPKYEYLTGTWEGDIQEYTRQKDNLIGTDGKNLYRAEQNLESYKSQYERKSQPSESQWLFEGELETLETIIADCSVDIERYHKDLAVVEEKLAELYAIPEDER